jgi:predicted regulator of Ras-like GTPase activity (Roadblock/LC7/MglB family)
MLKKSLASFAILGLGTTLAFAAIAGFPDKTQSKSVYVSAVADDEDKDDDDEKEDEEKDDDENVMKLNDLPAAAKAAVKKAAGDHQVTEVKSEKEYGATVYEAAWKVDGVEHEIVVTADGSVVEMEEVVAMDKAPKAVQKTAAKHFKKGTELVVEKKTIVVYSIEAMIDGKEKEILLSATGQPIEIEADDEADDDKDSDDDDDDDSKRH